MSQTKNSIILYAILVILFCFLNFSVNASEEH